MSQSAQSPDWNNPTEAELARMAWAGFDGTADSDKIKELPFIEPSRVTQITNFVLAMRGAMREIVLSTLAPVPRMFPFVQRGPIWILEQGN